MAKAKTSKKAGAKKTASKTVAKKTVRKKAGIKKGNKYICGVCGLTVTVDTACGCVETAHLLCCEKPMKKKR